MSTDATLVDNRYNQALSAITYGLHCLVLDPRTNRLHDCILSVHEEYINILHLIVSAKASYLLKLHEIYNITDNEFSTESILKDYGIRNTFPYCRSLSDSLYSKFGKFHLCLQDRVRTRNL
jgi:hypothetical protein